MVKHGDTLARIAQHHHCSVKQLQAWNGLKPSSRLKLGQVLHVASPETVRAIKAANAQAAQTAEGTQTSQAVSKPTVAASTASIPLAAQQGLAAQSGQATLPAPSAAE